MKPILIDGGGSVCVERHGSDYHVVGNTASRGRLWVAVIINPAPGGTYEAELAAMSALMNAVAD